MAIGDRTLARSRATPVGRPERTSHSDPMPFDRPEALPHVRLKQGPKSGLSVESGLLKPVTDDDLEQRRRGELVAVQILIHGKLHVAV